MHQYRDGKRQRHRTKSEIDKTANVKIKNESQQQNHGKIRDNYGKISKENENLRKERMIILYKMNPTTQIK